MVSFPQVVGVTWIIFIVYWILNWGNSKPTEKRDFGDIPVRLAAFVIVVVVIFILRKFQLVPLCDVSWTGCHFEEQNGILGIIFSIAGVTIAIIARHTLGSNWSGNVELKKGHRLITNGIYSVVRHPIYLGILLMMIGTLLVFESGLVLIIFFFAACVFAFRIKREEGLMMKTFPKEYPKYKKNVRSLIPFII